VLHKIFPIAIVVDWLLDPPLRMITIRQAAYWLVYPLAWVAYSMIRGGLTGRYPYPFLDPANGDYGTVALYIVGILVLGVFVIMAVVVTARLVSRRESGANRAG